MDVSCRLFHFLLAVQVAWSMLISTGTKRRVHLTAHDADKEPSVGDWETLGQIAAITSPWLSIYCERMLDDKDQELDYWRVEKDHSVIVLVVHKNRLVFPKKQYRPGVVRKTLDFPGGRSPPEKAPLDAVNGILKRELDIDLDKDVLTIYPLNEKSGWLVNSSFSNQELFGFVAELRETLKLDPELLHNGDYLLDDANEIDELLQSELTCLQCRAVLMEYLMRQSRLNNQI